MKVPSIADALVNSPLLSRSLSSECVDLRRPFSDYQWLEGRFAPTPSLLNLLSTARAAGARTLVLEDIAADKSTLSENALLKAAYDSYKMDALKRLSFWTSHFRESDEVLTERVTNLVGVAIVKGENIDIARESTGWTIVEAILRPHFMPTSAFIPKSTIFKVCCLTRQIALSGILFCGSNSMNRTCAEATLKSLASYLLGRYIANAETAASSGCSVHGEGMTLADVKRFLDSVGLASRLFKLDDLPRKVNLEEILINAIKASAGALLAFPTQDNTLFHVVFVYGYTINPSNKAADLIQHYFLSGNVIADEHIRRWVDSFLFLDCNIGAYCSMPPGLLTARTGAVLVISASSVAQTDVLRISYITKTVLHRYPLENCLPGKQVSRNVATMVQQPMRRCRMAERTRL